MGKTKKKTDIDDNNASHDDHIDIPVLDEIIFPTDDMVQTPKSVPASKKKAKQTPAAAQITLQAMQKPLAEHICQRVDELIHQAVLNTLQDSIPIICEDVKDIVMSKLEPEIEKIVADALKML